MLSSYNNPSRIKTMSTRTMSLNYYMNSIFLSGLISLILLSNTPNHFFFIFFFFFFNDTPTPEIYTLPLHDALPISTSALETGPGIALNCLVQPTVALAMARSRPRFGELEVPDPCNSSEVSTVVGHEDQPRLTARRSEEHTSELQSQSNLVCRLLLEK